MIYNQIVTWTAFAILAMFLSQLRGWGARPNSNLLPQKDRDVCPKCLKVINRGQKLKKKNLPHPGVVCQAKVFGEGHQHPTPDTVLEKRE